MVPSKAVLGPSWQSKIQFEERALFPVNVGGFKVCPEDRNVQFWGSWEGKAILTDSSGGREEPLEAS